MAQSNEILSGFIFVQYFFSKQASPHEPLKQKPDKKHTGKGYNKHTKQWNAAMCKLLCLKQ